MFIRRSCLALVAILAALRPASSQIASTTSLVGAVTDSSGKAISGGKVTATNTDTKDAYNTVTNEQGFYRVDFVRVGRYDISVEHPGFSRYAKTGVVVETNQTVRNDITLEVGSISQSVSVEATTPAIRTDDASVSQIVTTREIVNLPLSGRNPMKLATTMPGVLSGQKDPSGTPPGEGFIGAGTREIQNSMALDGISIMNNLITTTPTRPMVESVQEVEVQTGTYSAQYGAYMGVHINMVTKSGTNQLHGNLVEFLRNNALDARNYFLSPTARKAVLRQNQFGFELDGPVVIPKLFNGRDKTFFMVSYEGLRLKKETASLSAVMTPAMFNGDFSGVPGRTIIDPETRLPFPNNQIPASRISPVVRRLQQYYIAPNQSGVNNNLTAAAPGTTDTNQTVDRFDQNIGDSVRLYFRYQRQTGTITNGAPVEVNGRSSPLVTTNYSAGYTHTISPSLVNDFRFGRNFFDSTTYNPFFTKGLASAGADLGIPGFDSDVAFSNPGIPDFTVAGFTAFANGSTNWYQDDKTWQFSDQISWTRGSHSIMAGAEFRKMTTGRAASNNPRGLFTFDGTFTGYAPADFVLGIPFSLATPKNQTRGVVTEWRDGFFVLDNWQASRKLTINYGIRYELPTVPYSANGFHSLLNPEQTAMRPSNPPQVGLQFIAPTHKNWAPRLGMAYRLTNKTVVRGGYGIYYNPNQTNTFTLLNGNPPWGITTTYTSSQTTPTLSLSNPIPVGSGPAAAIPNWTTVNWNLPTPYMSQWSFGIARELWANSGIEAGYLGSRSVHLDRSYFNNTPLAPGPGAIADRRPNKLFGQIRTIQNDMVANYEGLSLTLRQRFSRGLQFQAGYTWSHSIDVSNDSNAGGAPMNPYNWRADYGNSNWDIRHRLVTSFVYSLPAFGGLHPIARTVLGNWQANGIITYQSGIPFNVTIAGDRANTSSQGTQRPDVVGVAKSDCGSGHLVGCIDTNAFATPALYTYGNAGRNILKGPSLFANDVSFFKNFSLVERLSLQFRAEFFNLLNSPQFSNPSAVYGTAAFGSITTTSIDNRITQFGLKLIF